MPFFKFIEIACKGNIYALVIEGKPNDADLIKAWSNIHSEYADEMGNGEHKLYASVFAETSILAATYKQICVLIELLYKCSEINIFPGDLFTELNTLLHTKFAFKENEPEKNIEYLKRCKNRSNGVKMRLDLQQEKLNAMQAKKGDSEPADMNYFISILLTLSDHAGFHISDNITVFEYCARVKRYNVYCEQLKKSHARK